LSQRQVQRLQRCYQPNSTDWHLAGCKTSLSAETQTAPLSLPAPARVRFGMMALTDASRHDWLQGRGPHLTLLGFQDDATGQILSAHFQLEAENTMGYLRALHAMIVAHGLPLSLYHGGHAIFQRSDSHWTLAKQLAGKQAPTQLGRALQQLGIQQIPA
jgi:hypothetical protein